MRHLASDYMHFAKVKTGAKYNLAISGVPDCALADLEPRPEDFALHGPNAYGWPALNARIAARYGVPEACVVTPGGGCSFANHLAMAALVAPGDEVLIENPVYDLIADTLGFLGADIRRFERRRAAGFVLDPEAVGIGPRTRLIVITDLHNPSGVRADPAAVAAIAAAAARVGAFVLIDEVYLELLAEGEAAPTNFRPDGNIIVTASLTKAYGLSGLRCGWILAPEPVARRLERLNDLFGVRAPFVAETLALRAFDRLPVLRERARRLLAANRAAYAELLGDHPALDQGPPGLGTTAFPRLLTGEDGEALYARLMAEHETCITPGRFFGDPQAIRIGLCGDPDLSREGYRRLAQALRV